MNLKIDQLIFKYKLLKRDCIENEKFKEAKIAKDILEDLEKLKEINNKLK